MLALFRTNQIVSGIFFLLYLVLLRGIAFVYPEQYADTVVAQGFASQWIEGWLSGQPFWMEHTLAILLLFGQALYISNMLRRHRLGSSDILIPGALYLLVASAIPVFQGLSPMLLANSFLLVGIDQLLKTYRNQRCADHLFNTGFWLAVASFFYFSYSIFLILSILGLSALRVFRGKEVMMIITGAIVPYFLAGTAYFWNDQFGAWLQQHFHANIGFLSFTVEWNLATYLQLGLMTLLLLIVLISYGSLMGRQNILFQKKLGIFYYTLLACLFSVLLQANIELAHLFMLTIPIGIALGFLLKRMQKTNAEVFHLLLLAVILFLQFQPLLFVG